MIFRYRINVVENNVYMQKIRRLSSSRSRIIWIYFLPSEVVQRWSMLKQTELKRCKRIKLNLLDYEKISTHNINQNDWIWWTHVAKCSLVSIYVSLDFAIFLTKHSFSYRSQVTQMRVDGWLTTFSFSKYIAKSVEWTNFSDMKFKSNVIPSSMSMRST